MAFPSVPPTVSVRLIRNPGDKEAPPLQDEMLVTENMAVRRGTIVLNGYYYEPVALNVKTNLSIREHVKDGDKIYVNSEKFNVSSLYFLRNRQIIITRTTMTDQLNLERYEQPS